MKNLVYRIPKNYMSWSRFQDHTKTLSLVRGQKLTLENMPSINNMAYEFQAWAQGYPVYCIRQSLLEDMLDTDVGENLALFSSIELPIPCYLLFFPQKQVRSPTKKGWVDYLIVRHEELSHQDYKYLIAWSGIDSESGMIYGCKRIRRDGTLQRSAFATDDKQQQEGALTLRNLVLQSILLLQHYPKLAQTVYIPETKGFGSRQPKVPAMVSELFPRWLGEDRPSARSQRISGIGGSVRTHFRRGHQRRLDDRVVWVRPTWVNPS